MIFHSYFLWCGKSERWQLWEKQTLYPLANYLKPTKIQKGLEAGPYLSSDSLNQVTLCQQIKVIVQTHTIDQLWPFDQVAH